MKGIIYRKIRKLLHQAGLFSLLFKIPYKDFYIQTSLHYIKYLSKLCDNLTAKPLGFAPLYPYPLNLKFFFLKTFIF